MRNGLARKQPLTAIRQAVDQRFANIGKATPTPLPPAGL